MKGGALSYPLNSLASEPRPQYSPPFPRPWFPHCSHGLDSWNCRRFILYSRVKEYLLVFCKINKSYRITEDRVELPAPYPFALASLPTLFLNLTSRRGNIKGKLLVTPSCPTLCKPMDCSLPGSSMYGILQARVGVGCHSLPHGIFLTQGSNPHLPHRRQILYHLSHHRSPRNI